MLAESHPLLRRILRFLALPYCYIKLVNWNECTSSKLQVISDFVYIFFTLKYYPDNYTACRFWEKDRSQWAFYYASIYEPYQRYKMRREIQPFELLNLFDNKLVCDLLCRGVEGVNLPNIYGEIEPGREYINKIISAISKSGKTSLIIKPTNGNSGRGIVIVERDNNKYRVRQADEYIDLEDFQLKEKSVLQEIVVQDKRINKIVSSSLNTLRIVTLFTKSGEAIVISALMRFGVGGAYVDNWSSGGVAVGVNHYSGVLYETAYDKHGNKYFEHPDSKLRFEGFQVPEWDKVCELAIKVQCAFSFYKLLGLDIAITEDGPVLIEINQSTDIVLQEQTAGPLLADKTIFSEFEKYDLLINKCQKNLYKN